MLEEVNAGERVGASPVRLALQARLRAQGRTVPRPIELSDERLRDIVVPPSDLSSYDKISEDDDGEDPDDELRKLALELRLYGLLANWGEVASEPWLPVLLEMERTERARRSHEYRLRNAKIGAFKDRSQFDWKHPTKADRLQIDELFTLDFIDEGTNVVFVGPNGIGKTMLARNLAYEAVSRGVSTRYTSASDMLAALGGLTGSMLTQRLRRYTKATLLVVDELGYLRYDTHLADLLYEVISRRYDAEASKIGRARV